MKLGGSPRAGQWWLAMPSSKNLHMYSRNQIIKYLKKLYNTKLDDYLLIPKPMVKRIIELLEEPTNK